MSATDEESFIVIDETPSMLQFSLLDSLTLNSTNDLEHENSIASHTNGITSNENGNINFNIKPMEQSSIKLENSMRNAENDVSFGSFNADSFQSATTQHDLIGQTPPKTTLAQSFLLGDINCDKMKVWIFIFIFVYFFR